MILKFTAGLFFIFTGQISFAETCTYSIKEGSQKLVWTGFKYTNKTAVSGTFDKITFEQNKKAKSLRK